MTISVPQPVLMELSEFIRARMGLSFPRDNIGHLETGIRSAAYEFGFKDAKTCIEWLLSSPLTKQEIEILASHLTIGETYFFREKKSFKFLEEQMIPDLIRARSEKERYIRIWSAGCATGEEPYSIAILLHRLIPDLTEWNITILATDINTRFLGKARQGVYREWSFRDAPAWIRKYFSKRKDGSEILPEIKKMVIFSYHNLAEDTYPSIVNNTNAMDIIFCRNVLMYFSQERAMHAIHSFYLSLVDGGWLVVSPVETSSTLFSHYVTVNFQDSIFYRKDISIHYRGGFAPVKTLEGPPEKIMPIPSGSIPVPVYEEAILMARAYANYGKSQEALGWCEKALALDRMDPACHYLHAMILQESGRPEEAAKSLRRALYLDRDFILAHFTLGNLKRQQGKLKESDKYFDNALTLLSRLRKEDILPGSDGITAGRLYEIITSMKGKGISYGK